MQEIEELFNIEYDRLNQLLENVIQAPVTSFTYVISKKKQSRSGIVGDYAVPTFTIYPVHGKPVIKDLFFRREPEGQRGFRQIHHFHFLESQDIPTPNLFGWFIDQNECEILCMEYLEEITAEETFLEDTSNCQSFLDLMAHFAANRPSMEYLALIGRDMAYRGDYTREWKTWMLWSIYILNRTWDFAIRGELNPDLELFCRQNPVAKDRLQMTAQRMITTIYSFKLGIIHGDFKPGNTAWRDKELVVFDLEDMMLDCRFYDVAMYLGAPEELFRMDYQIRDDLVDYFIDRFVDYSGEKLEHEAFLRELQTIWFTRSLNLWEWLPNHLTGPSYRDPEKGKNSQERCEKLFSVLQALCHRLPVIEHYLTSFPES